GILRGVNPLAPAQVRHFDIGLHPRQDDPQLVRRLPLPPLVVRVHRSSSRFGSWILPSLEEAVTALPLAPFLLTHSSRGRCIMELFRARSGRGGSGGAAYRFKRAGGSGEAVLPVPASGPGGGCRRMERPSRRARDPRERLRAGCSGSGGAVDRS